jgi:hypothetical protein
LLRVSGKGTKIVLTEGLATNRINIMSIRKGIMSVVIASLLILPACNSKQENPVSTYVGAKKSASDAADSANLYALRQTVQTYHAANGNYPANLKDVEGMLGSPVDFSRYNYDPVTGTVTLKTQ